MNKRKYEKEFKLRITKEIMLEKKTYQRVCKERHIALSTAKCIVGEYASYVANELIENSLQIQRALSIVLHEKFKPKDD